EFPSDPDTTNKPAQPPVPNATLRVVDNPSYTLPPETNGVPNGMWYATGLPTVFNINTNPIVNHTLFLRRLAAPYLPYDPDPTSQTSNPSTPVDYAKTTPVNDGVLYDEVGGTTRAESQQPAPRASVGRMHPYAGHSPQSKPQAPNPAD